MVDSILNTIKQMLGISVMDTAFDVDIITHINSAFMYLQQLGVGTGTVYSIDDNTAKWSDFLTDVSSLSAVKTYIFLKVKLVFDPPVSSFVLESTNRHITELEWRLNLQADPPPPVVLVE